MTSLDVPEKAIGERFIELLPNDEARILRDVRNAVNAQVKATTEANENPQPLSSIYQRIPLSLRMDYLEASLKKTSDTLRSGLISVDELFTLHELNSEKERIQNFIHSQTDFPKETRVASGLCHLLACIIKDTDSLIQILKNIPFRELLMHIIQNGEALSNDILYFFQELAKKKISFTELAPFIVSPQEFEAGLNKAIEDLPKVRPPIFTEYLILFAQLKLSYPREPLIGAYTNKIKAVLEKHSAQVRDDLEKLGDDEIIDIVTKAFKFNFKPSTLDPLEEAINDPMGKAILRFVRQEQPKRTLFSTTPCLGVFKNPQEWITINSPDKVQKIYDMVRKKTSAEKFQALHRVLADFLRRQEGQLVDEDFNFYADEILDGLVQFISQNKSLQSDSDLSRALDECHFGFRYMQRTEEDLRLGNKTGDCTAVGSINFEKALTWYVNPLYQIILLKNGSRFLGRINCTIGNLKQQPILLVDAVEFNPQVEVSGDSPNTNSYNPEAKTAFKKTIAHLLQFAKKEERTLILYTGSNSTHFDDWVKESTTNKKLPPKSGKEPLALQLNNPIAEVKATLNKVGYSGPCQLWVQSGQSSGYIPESSRVSGAKDKIAASLERSVFNPAQMESPEIAEAMRRRDFGTAAEYLIQRYIPTLESILGFQPDKGFLVRKMEVAYPNTPLTTVEKPYPIQINSVQFLEVTGMAA